MDEKLDLILGRLKAAEDKRKWMAPTIIVALIGAIISAAGVVANGVSSWLDNQHKEKQFALEIQDAHQAYIKQLAGDYEQQRIGVKAIATVNPDIEVAIKIERIFRTGGTIRGLVDFRDSLCINDCDDGDSDLVKQQAINNALEGVPSILFIDSKSRHNAYCENTRENFGTNLEDVVRSVRDLPFHIDGAYGDIDQNLELKDNESPHALVQTIYDKQPQLIVIHLGAFDAVRYAGEEESNNSTTIDIVKMRTFLNELQLNDFNNRLDPLRQIIVYSRSGSSLTRLMQSCIGDSSCIHPEMAERITPVDFEGGGRQSASANNSEGCFYVGGDPSKLSDNGRRMRRAIFRHLDQTML